MQEERATDRVYRYWRRWIEHQRQAEQRRDVIDRRRQCEPRGELANRTAGCIVARKRNVAGAARVRDVTGSSRRSRGKAASVAIAGRIRCAARPRQGDDPSRVPGDDHIQPDRLENQQRDPGPAPTHENSLATGCDVSKLACC